MYGILSHKHHESSVPVLNDPVLSIDSATLWLTMSAIWVEVRQKDDKDPKKNNSYFWNRKTGQTCWEEPEGIRVLWAMERHPTTGKSYFWNKETQRSVWNLPTDGDPPGGRGGQPAMQRDFNSLSRGERWADQAPDPDDDHEAKPRSPSGPSRGVAPATAAARTRAEEPSPAPKHPILAQITRNCKFVAESECGHHFLRAAVAVEGVRDCTPEEAKKLIPTNLGCIELLLLECRRPTEVMKIFPWDFVVVGPPAPTTFGPGFFVAVIGECPREAREAVIMMTSCWWSLVKETNRPVTLIYARPLATATEEECEEEEQSLLLQQKELQLVAPTTLLLAGWRGRWGQKRERYLANRWGASSEAQAAAWYPTGDDWTENPSPGCGWGESAPSNGRAWQEQGWGDDEGWNDGEWIDYDPDEVEIVKEIEAYLARGPREVQDLAANFAPRFNAIVRMNPQSPYHPDKKNDGSFKKWLQSWGFLTSPLYDRNKSKVSVPASGIPYPSGVVGGAGYGGQTEGGRSRRRRAHTDAFEPPFGVGSREAAQLEKEVLDYLTRHQQADMGALRQVNNLGARFNQCFFQKFKVNDGSWKRWLASLPGTEVVVDPRTAAHHGNQPTIVRLMPWS